MEFVLAAAVIVIVLCAALLARRGRGGSEGQAATPAAHTDVSATDLVVYEDDRGSTLLVQPLREQPPGASPVPAGVASKLIHETTKLAPQLRQAAQGGGRKLYRLVHSPPGGLQRVKPLRAGVLSGGVKA